MGEYGNYENNYIHLGIVGTGFLIPEPGKQKQISLSANPVCPIEWAPGLPGLYRETLSLKK